ncbi:MAG: hypothetical protein NTY22_03575 [Proteobacteria bacterium]|nr:hypothetical protein [Pseudomonadota bacterium]
MIYAVITFSIICVLWLFIKKAVLKFVLTLAIMIFPAFILFYNGGYAYSILFTFLIILFMYLNDFKKSHKNNYKKIITVIPIAALFYWLAIPKNGKFPGPRMLENSELKIAVILSCISIFIAVMSALLILKRTKGEKAHE